VQGENAVVSLALKTLRDAGVLTWKGGLPGWAVAVEVTFAPLPPESSRLPDEDHALAALRRIQEATEPMSKGEF